MKKIIKINLIFLLILVLALPLFGKEKKVVNFQMVTQIPASNNSETVTLESSGDTLLNESFEGTVTGWSYIDNDGDGGYWGIYEEDATSDAAHTGTHGVGVLYNSAGNDDWFITPKIGIPTGTTVSFSFWAHSYSSSYLEDFNVKLSTSGTSMSDFTVRLDSVTDVPYAWTKYTYDLSSYAGDSINLAVQCVSIDELYLYADDFLLIAESSVGNTITSTTTGGLWDQTTTWIGGVVPTATDDVIIDGTVKYNSPWPASISLECMNITINSGDSLFCDSFGPYGVTLKIGGDIINNGTISQDGTYTQADITVMGNITNYGEFSNGTILMQSDAAQSITSTNQMEVYKIEMENGQNLIAGSDLTFIDTYFQFNNGEFIIGNGTTVSFYSTEGGEGNGRGHVDKAHIKGGGTIFSGGFNSTANVYYFQDSTTVENITLTGNIRGKADFAILGGVVNKDTLQQAEDNYPVNINVFEDFTNKGVIRDNPTDNDNLTLVIHKNFTNEGTINNQVLVLANETAQTLSATQPIEVSRIEIQNGQDIIAGSNIEFLNVGWVNMNGYYETDDFANVVIDNEKTVAFKLNKLADTHIMKMHFKGGGTLYAETYGSAIVQFRDSTSVENVTLTGTISGTGNFRLLSNVTNKDTLQGCGNQYGDAIIVEEDFVNDGVIRNGPYNYLQTNIRKNVTNKGSWVNNWAIMEGTADQSFTNEGELTSSFEFRSNVSLATTFQWYKDGVAIDGATSEYYKYYYDSYNPQNYDPYGVYYCQTNAGNSRIITLNDSSATIVAGFYATPTTGTVPLGVTFTDTSNGTATSWNWHFGDEDSSSSNNPSHTYTTAGNYSVSLTVSDDTNESTETKNSYIIVTEVVEDSSNWTTLHPTPTSNTIVDVQFVNSSIGYACGTKGTLIKTIDGGDDWKLIKTGVSVNLTKLHFGDENIGYIVGEDGTVLKTVNGGEVITQSATEDTIGTRDLFSVYFTDANNGFVGGDVYSSVIWKTTDGGNNWHEISLPLESY
ncbi:MAG: choice-of-anchor J domain-containing protein, partial [Candidatus Marinimicrobia bacterium]|nr:choice-of-anchor J domain-containing protein [Candidatus Neomarinimicrobiota bacterium]